jgi:hypothetical protein
MHAACAHASRETGVCVSEPVWVRCSPPSAFSWQWPASASLAGRAPVLGALNDTTGEAIVLLLLGLFLLWAGIAFWRRCRRRLRRPSDLSLSPSLMKKRD